MRLRILTAVLTVLAVAVAAPADARPRPPAPAALTATYDVDTRVLTARVTCRAAAAPACRGRLVVDVAVDGRRLRLRSTVAPRRGAPATLRRRLTPGEARRMLEADGAVFATLRRRGRAPLDLSASLAVRASCRSGRAVAADGDAVLRSVPGAGILLCRAGAEAPVVLADGDAGVDPATVRLAGPFAAYASTGGHRCLDTHVVVVDVASRRPVTTVPAGARTVSVANGCDGSAGVAALVLRPSGAVAWITGVGDAGVREVWRADATGAAPELLDAGADVAPGSLTLAATTVTWTRGGAMRAAALP